MPWDFSPEGWYAFARGSSVHIRKGSKNYLADVSVYSEDSLDKAHHSGKFKDRDLESVALKALAYLSSKTGKVPVQIDLEHSGVYPVSIRTEDDEIAEVVRSTVDHIEFERDFDEFINYKE